jgi:Uma2 family endonuclease
VKACEAVCPGSPPGAKQNPAVELGSKEQEEKTPLLCPVFVVELMSPSDRRTVRVRMIQAKMEEYIANGVQLGWFIDPFQKKVYIYRPTEPAECLDNPADLCGDPVLPGFVLNMNEVWTPGENIENPRIYG